MKVAFQGVRGAYSEMAALKYFKTKDIKFFPKFTLQTYLKPFKIKKSTLVLYQLKIHGQVA